MKYIPFTIHQIWLQGKDNIKDSLIPYQQKWEEVYSNDYILWTEVEILELFNNKNYTKLSEIYHSCITNAGKADIARYVILNEYGGIYVDMDCEYIKNIEPLIDNYDFIAAWENKHNNYLLGTIGNSFIGSIPKHPILTNLLHHLSTTYYNPIIKPQYNLGPHLLTTYVKKYETCNTKIYSYNFVYLDTITDDTYIIHKWDNSWTIETQSITGNEYWVALVIVLILLIIYGLLYLYIL